MHLTIHGMKNYSIDGTEKTKKGWTESNMEEVDLTHQSDTETQAGGVNPTTDDKLHWMNTNTTTDTD